MSLLPRLFSLMDRVFLKKRSCVKCSDEHIASECTKSVDDPCIFTNCSGPHPANYRLCPKFLGDHTQENVKSLAKQNQRKGHPTRKVNKSISFAASQKAMSLNNALIQSKICQPPKLVLFETPTFKMKYSNLKRNLENKLFSKPSESVSRSTALHLRTSAGYL